MKDGLEPTVLCDYYTAFLYSEKNLRALPLVDLDRCVILPQPSKQSVTILVPGHNNKHCITTSMYSVECTFCVVSYTRAANPEDFLKT